MRNSRRRQVPDPPPPLSTWTIVFFAVLVLGVAIIAGWAAERRYGGAEPGVELAAIRTVGTLVVGTGGVVALLLATRRQRSTELGLMHTEHDATERRITELYGRAAEQLGSDKAPLRLAGLYALERLAHSTAEHRQTIVDVICAYLRMPYTPPTEVPPPEEAPASDHERYDEQRQELQVRRTAQDILLRNLQVPPAATPRLRWLRRAIPQVPAWPDIRLDLGGAPLVNLTFAVLSDQRGGFRGGQFVGNSTFADTKFTGTVDFADARFHGSIDFDKAQFTESASFGNARFLLAAFFTGARFDGEADFTGAAFTDLAAFLNAAFVGPAFFFGVEFLGRTDFSDAQFTGPTEFFAAPVARAADDRQVLPECWTTRSTGGARRDGGVEQLVQDDEPPPPT